MAVTKQDLDKFIKFLKVRRVKSPVRANEYDAGIDFFVPEFDRQFIKDLKEKNPLIFNKNKNLYEPGFVHTDAPGAISMSNGDNKVTWDLSDNNDTLFKMDDEKGENYFILPPHSRIMLPSGIKSRMAGPGRALIAANKSGVATKHGLVVGACVDKETIIETNKGKFTAGTLTKEFKDANNIKIKGYDEITKQFNYYEFDGFRVSGEKESIRLIFNNNTELICSEDHKILTINGWKIVRDINENDELVQ
jgi:hypothetical protein